MGTTQNLIGKRFDRLLVKEYVETTRQGYIYLCVCDCGNETKADRYRLTKGIRKSCGCKMREIGKRSATHGKTKTKEHISWVHMRQRCNNPNTVGWENYGGRGITICERWSDFSLFLEDMGVAPSTNHTLDRIDVNEHYTPENCRWADKSVQARNTRGKKSRQSKYKGLTKAKSGKWVARINVDGKSRYLGVFSSEEDAAQAYQDELKLIEGFN